MNENEIESLLQDLAPQAHAGDERAVREMVRTAYPIVRAYCARRIGTSLDPHITGDDVAHDVCVALMSSIGGCRRRPILPFVYGVAVHKVADARRRAHRHGRQDHDPTPPQTSDDEPAQAVVQAELRELSRLLVDSLPERERQILHMRFTLDMSAERMAAVLGTTPGAVRVAQHRALAKLMKRAPDVR